MSAPNPPSARKRLWPAIAVAAIIVIVGVVIGGVLGRSAGAAAEAGRATPTPSVTQTPEPEPTPSPTPTSTPTPPAAPVGPESCADLLSATHAAAIDAEFELIHEAAPGADPEDWIESYADPLLSYGMVAQPHLECTWRLDGQASIAVSTTTLDPEQDASMAAHLSSLVTCRDGLSGTLCEDEYGVEGGTDHEQHLFRDGVWIAVVHNVYDQYDGQGNDVVDRPWDEDFLPLVADHLFGGATS
jgi:hypothetical protein